MKPFDVRQPESLGEALALLRDDPAACVLAGGTDLLPLIKRGVAHPGCLVDLTRLPDLAGVRVNADGCLAIGATTRLSDIAADARVAAAAPLLLDVLGRTASPQIRNQATLGGNLCQRPRCLYFRHPGFACARKGGTICHAAAGVSRSCSILGGPRCFMAHPSDLAPALVALDAQVLVLAAAGSRTATLAELYVAPSQDPTRELALSQGEIIAEIRIPAADPGTRTLWARTAERRALDFALASVAVLLTTADGTIGRVRVVFGAVAPTPWRSAAAEGEILDRPLSQESIERACNAALADARPLAGNRFKVDLARHLLRRALTDLARG